MKKTTFKFFALIFLLQAFAAANAQDPQKAKMTSFGRGYLEYLPAGYETSTEKYPAIIFLHGSGERGLGSPTDLEKVKANGPPKHIKNGHKMGFTVNGKTEYFIVLSPQTNDWSWKYDVVPFVKYALENYRIDPDRVYLTGLSMGGEGTWFGVSLEDNSPNLFAAAGVMCGRANESDGTNVATKKIPVWAFHGDSDTAIPMSAGQRPLIGMIKANAYPAPIFTVYAGGSHGTAWDRGYRTDHSYHNPNLYEWFLMQNKSVTPTPPANLAPTVNAGVDKNVVLPTSTTTLSASASDTDGSIITYAWGKVSGPAATLTNTSLSTLSVSNMTTAGTYTFKVTVTDSRNTTATDQVVVTVGGTANAAPTVNAGTDKNITLPTNNTTLTAAATDTDGTIASYTWTKVSGPTATLTNTTSSTLSVSDMTTQGTYTFSVTAKDNLNATATDQVVVTVAPAANVAPTVNAGVDANITLPTSGAVLSATAADTDGTIASYAWSQVSGPAATLTNAGTSTLTVTNMVAAGTYTFNVTATDNQNATAADQVTVVVAAAPVNQLPVVEAGEKQYITLPVNSATFNAVASDVDGAIASYTWKKIGGSSTIVMSGTNSATLNVSGVVAGTYVFRVEVADNTGAKAADTVRLKVNEAIAGRLSTTAEVTVAEVETTQLGQNYPNPFSSQTTIPYAVEVDQQVVIKVYNTNGVEVATVLNEMVQAGSHSVQVDATRLGNASANAIYYYKMFAAGKVTTKQLVLMQ